MAIVHYFFNQESDLFDIEFLSRFEGLKDLNLLREIFAVKVHPRYEKQK
jgi:hypothetical protein